MQTYKEFKHATSFINPHPLPCMHANLEDPHNQKHPHRMKYGTRRGTGATEWSDTRSDKITASHPGIPVSRLLADLSPLQ